MKVTAEDIAQLLASAPPRLVPAHVAKAAVRGGGGWLLPLFGLFFGGIGLLVGVMFFPWRFRDDWRLTADSAQTARGVITAVTKTNMSINKQHVMEYDFRYTPEDGRVRPGRCYTTGQVWSSNAPVTVRYLPAEPAVACVEGARLSEGSWGSAFVMIFPLIGGALIAWFFLDRRQTRRLLHDGLVAEVDVVSVEETATRVNGRPLYKIVITGPALQGGQPLTARRVNRADIDLALKHAEEKQPVFVLYDPQKHRRVLFPEALIDSDA